MNSDEIILGVHNKIIGYPGTGKTTLLINELIRLRNNFPELRITYLSFTNEAVNTARDRLFARIDGKSVVFGTIHSIAKRVTANSRKLIHWDTRNCEICKSSCEYHLREFAKLYTSWYYDEEIKLDYTFTKYTLKIDGLYALNKNFNEPVFDMTLHYALSSLIVSNFGSEVFDKQIIYRINKLVSQIDIPRYSLLTSLEELMDFTIEWLEYKKNNGLFEFDDLILHAMDKSLDTDILIVDEFQDLSTLQYQLISKWGENIDTVVVAGDYNQSIYGFQGGTPQFLLDFECGHKIVLRHTYRLPRKVLEIAKDILQDENGFNSVYSNRDDGDISRINLEEIDINQLIIEYDSIFLLCRTNRQIKELDNKLNNLFRNRLSIAERAAYARMLNLYRNRQRGKINELLKQHSGRGELFLLAMDNGLTLQQLEKKFSVLQMKTIHSSKGLEADIVILYDQSDRDMYSDEERRVWYVGLTRSRGSLIILQEITRKRTNYLSLIQ